MNRLISVGLSAAVFLGLTSGVAFSDDDDDDDDWRTTGYQYSIKYICGEPGVGATVPIANADLRTAINVVNANDRDTNVARAIVPTEGTDSPVIEGFTPMSALDGYEIDCPAIWSAFGGQQDVYGPFEKGIVVLRSCKPLEVVAVYTGSRGPQTGAPSATSSLVLDVEPIKGREIRLSKANCYRDRRR